MNLNMKTLNRASPLSVLRWCACAAASMALIGCMSSSFSPELDWAPVVEGHTDLRFKGLQIAAPIMASAGSTQKVTLTRRVLGREWGKNEFTTLAMPLAASLVQSGSFKVRSIVFQKNEYDQMLEAVLFLPSVSPEILLAAPDALPPQGNSLHIPLYRHQAGIRKILDAHRLWMVPAVFEYCPTTPDPETCTAMRTAASKINNAVLVTRLIPDRDDLVMVADGKVQPLGRSRKLSAGGKAFELVPVSSEPGMLELRPVR
jgi:hypothetical protein